MNNKTIMKYNIILLLIIVSFLACKDLDEDLNKDISVPVSVMDIDLKSIEKYIVTTGTVNPVKEAVIKAEITGNYKLLNNPKTKKPWALGDKINKGSRIISLYNNEFQNNLQINSKKLQLEISKQTLDKQKSLYEKGGVTLSELKNAEIQYINAKYAYQDALISIQKMYIKAPFTGIITELPYYTQGVKIDASSVLVKLMDYSKLQMEIEIPEKNINTIEPGLLVEIMNYTLPNDTLKGSVTQISPAIDIDSRSFKAIVEVDNQELKLRPGMFAKGRIIITAVDSTIVIPKEIIQTKERGHTVFVVNKKLAQERIINFGIENPEEVQIISGLDTNDRVIIKGFETLRNRTKIKEIK